MEKFNELRNKGISQKNGARNFNPWFVWCAKLVGLAVLGYFTYEVIDGFIRGFTSVDCSC